MQTFDIRYPTVTDLERRAAKRMPRFAYDYLRGGAMEETALKANHYDLKQIKLKPHYLSSFAGANQSARLFGHTYSAPFGVAPIGLQGMMWPDSPRILAAAAAVHNIPFVFGTLSTERLETIAKISEGRAWYQLYNPTDTAIRDDLLKRAKACGYKVLVVTVDIPSHGFRPRDIRNSLGLPPRLTAANIWAVMKRPAWLLQTLRMGIPDFQNLKPYMSADFKAKRLGDFMDRVVMGSTDLEGLKPIRDQWQGALVIKGILSEEDAELSYRLGAEGIVISNHGGRQLDVAESPIRVLPRLSALYENKMVLMMDSGLRDGADLAVALALGAKCGFLGRAFMYSVAALGRFGGEHLAALLKVQLQQVMTQLGCENLDALKTHLVAQNS